MRNIIKHTTMAAIFAFLAMFLLWPLADVFKKAFFDKQGATLHYMLSLFRDPANIQAIWTTSLIAVLTTVCATLIALPIAWIMARRSFAGRTILSGMLLVPLILPPFVGAVGMKIVFSRSGALSTLLMKLGITDGPIDWLGAWPLLGVVIMEALHLFPILYLNLAAAFSNIDPSLEEAAANAGASPWRVFKRVTLPLAWPGLFAGTVLVFIWSFTELGAPLVFGIRRVLPVMIYDKVNEAGTNPMGYAMTVFLLVVAVLGFIAAKAISRRRGGDVATLGRLSIARTEQRLSPGRTLAVYVAIGAVLLLALVPHISVILLSVTRRWFLTVLPEGFTLDFFARAMASDMTRTALKNSLLLATAATILDVGVGFCIAWLCVRTRTAGAWLLDALAMLPLAIPGLVVAFGYLGCFPGVFRGTLLDPRYNPMLLLAIGYSIRRMPYMVRMAHAGLEQTSRTYEEAAMNLGASPLRTIWRITLPLIAANLLAGGILCFAFSMLEVSDSLILAQTETYYPITKAIYTVMEQLENGVNVAAALGVWAMALLAAAMLWVSALLGRKMGQMFRAG